MSKLRQELKTEHLVSDEHKFPFSLVCKNSQNASVINRSGDVSEHMNKIIGRPTHVIRGSISANNYLELDKLNLIGPFVYVQLCQIPNAVTTFHLELITSNNLSIRVSVSTIYDGEKPKFLARSLRLPLPKIDGWAVFILDINRILSTFCQMHNNSTHSDAAVVKSGRIKKIQMCSNMILRDIVTSDKLYSADLKTMPKELLVKPSEHAVRWIDLCDYGQQQSILLNEDRHVVDKGQNSSNGKALRLQRLLSASPQTPSPSILTTRQTTAPVVNSDLSVHILKKSSAVVSGGDVEEVELEQTKEHFLSRELTTADLVASPNMSKNDNDNNPNGDSVSVTPRQHDSSGNDANRRPSHLMKTEFTRSNFRLSQMHSTPDTKTAFSSFAHTNHIGISPNGVVRYNIPDAVSRANRLLHLERISGYRGGPCALLYDSRMMVFSSGSVIVLVDLEQSNNSEPPKNGLWKAFHATSAALEIEKIGFRQGTLKGHAGLVGIIEVSETGTLMATGEINCVSTTSNRSDDGPALILWDLVDGRRLVTLRPHTDTITAVSFNADCSMLVTAGTDAQFRHQIVVWDLHQLILERGTVSANNSSCSSTASLVIARQISEFHINCIRFSPFEEFSLVSCGRENIRFWRIRKGHLPGRPVLLNEYSRGFLFTHLVFNMDSPSAASSSTSSNIAKSRPTLYVASNKGMLLRISCVSTQVLSAFQLHTAPIRALALKFGYAVTGGDDCMMRVWPLNFSDFLLEAKHEGPVTSIHMSCDGRMQAIGTAAGTLGILNVSDHSYNTVLRSHVGGISKTISRGNNWHEIATIGSEDHTVRVWDVLSSNQIIEFTCGDDQPTCLCYNAVENQLICGFNSGFVRVFDVNTAAVIAEKATHASRIEYIHLLSITDNATQLLVTVAMDGTMIVLSVMPEGFAVYKTVTVFSSSGLSSHVENIVVTVSSDDKYLALSSGCVGSLVILDASDFSVVCRLAHSPGVTGSTPDARPESSQTFKGSARSADSSTPVGESSVSLSAPVVSLCFCPIANGGCALLITTEKHFIGLPVLHPFSESDSRSSSRLIASVQRQSLWDKRSVRRIDFGCPTLVVRDTATGLLFMTLRVPIVGSKKTAGPQLTDRLSENAVAIAVLDLTIGCTAVGIKLSAYHSPQLYQDLPGVVNDICPCLQADRVVSVDDSGCMIMWKISTDNLHKWRATAATVMTDKHLFEEEEVQNIYDDVSVVASNDVMTTTTPTSSHELTYNAQDAQLHSHQIDLMANTLDFERAARDNPSVWSAQSITHSRQEGIESVDDAIDRFSSMYQWEEATPGPGNSVEKGKKSSPNKDETVEFRPSVDSDSENENEDIPLQPTKVSLPVTTTTAPPKQSSKNKTLPPIVDDVSNTYVKATDVKKVDKKFAKVTMKSNWRGLLASVSHGEEKTSVVSSQDAMEVECVSHRNELPPCFSSDNTVIVSSDGVTIFVEHTASAKTFALRVPEYLASFSMSSVIACSLSHTADCIAAILQVQQQTEHSDSNATAYCLAVWKLSHGYAECCWSLVGLADIGGQRATWDSDLMATGHRKVQLLWDVLDNSLYVAACLKTVPSTGSPVPPEDILRVTVLSPESLNQSDRLQDAVLKSTFTMICPVARGLSFLKILPRVGNKKVSLVVASSAHIFLITAVKPTIDNPAYNAKVQWSDDMGKRGPVLGLDTTCSSFSRTSLKSCVATASKRYNTQDISRRICAFLDSYGSVKFVELYWADDDDVSPALPPRSTTVQIAAANICGTLHSLALSSAQLNPHSQIYLALGATHMIRIFGVQIRDLGPKTITAQMTLMHKLSVDFTPRFYCFVKSKSRLNESSAKSQSPCLIVFGSEGDTQAVSLLEPLNDKLHAQPDCRVIRSALPICESTAGVLGMVQLSYNANLICFLTAAGNGNGHITVYSRAERGIQQVSSVKSIIRKGVCLSNVHSTLVAVGTRCGKVLIVDLGNGNNMDVVDMATLSTNVSSSVASSVATSTTSLPQTRLQQRHSKSTGLALTCNASSIDANTDAVHSIVAVDDGTALLASQLNGDLWIVQLYDVTTENARKSVSCKIPPVVPFERTAGMSPNEWFNEYQTHTIVATCHGGDHRVCGAVRRGSSILELYYTDHGTNFSDLTSDDDDTLLGTIGGAHRRRRSNWCNVLNLSLRLATTTDTNIGNIDVIACHLIFTGNTLIVYSICRSIADNSNFLSYGFLKQFNPSQSSPSVLAGPTLLPMSMTVHAVCGNQPNNVVCHCFNAGMCAVGYTNSIGVFDLTKFDFKNSCLSVNQTLVYKVELSLVMFGSTGGKWDHALLLDLSQDRETQTAQLTIYRNKTSVLLTFAFPYPMQ